MKHEMSGAAVEPAFEVLREALRAVSAAMSRQERDAALERLLAGKAGQ